MENRPDVSVIIPVYNQKDSLKITLRYFSNQRYPKDKYEIIVVDDGSQDGLMKDVQESSWPKLECNVKYISQKNQGRAIARNNGVSEARGRRLVFCDADRFPAPDFIKLHSAMEDEEESTALIGCPWDYFGHVKNLIDVQDESFKQIVRFSRKPLYYQKIQNLFDEKGSSGSGIAWASFLVGNSSVNMSDFERIGGFDSDFQTWGFEHFEFAIRLQKAGVQFKSCPDISSFHIPHSRGEGYYKSAIEENIQLLKMKHPQYDFDSFKKYFFGEISLQDFEQNYCGTVTEGLKNIPSVFYAIK